MRYEMRQAKAFVVTPSHSEFDSDVFCNKISKMECHNAWEFKRDVGHWQTNALCAFAHTTYICMYYAPFHSTSATSVASSMSTGCRKCNSQTPSNIVTQWIEQLQFSQTPNRLFVWCCRLVVAQQRDDDHQTMFVFCYFLGMTVRWEAICWYMAGRVEIETSIQDDMRWSVELQLSDYRYMMCVVHHSLWTTKPGDRTLVTEHLLCFSIQLSQSTSLVISSSARSASASVATVRHMRNINL